MAPTKLSDSDRQDILARYRQPGETTSTLASRFGVSSTTISRILKRGLSPEDYEALVQQKRAVSSKDSLTAQTELISPSEQETASPVEATASEASAPTETDQDPQAALESTPEPNIEQPTLFQANPSSDPVDSRPTPPVVKAIKAKLETPTDLSQESDSSDSNEEFTEILDEEVNDLEADGDDEFEDEADESLDELDGDDEFADTEEFDISEDGDEEGTIAFQLPQEDLLQVLPLAEARLPKTCYLVIDRGAELVTRPLRDFGELGQLPEEEVQARTLPVFDNHRVARRFSRRTQRIVKVPNGELLYKTSPYLQAKGITRLLIDGQVYAL